MDEQMNGSCCAPGRAAFGPAPVEQPADAAAEPTAETAAHAAAG